MYLTTSQFDGEGPGLEPSPAVSNDAAASPVSAAGITPVVDEQTKMAGYREAGKNAVISPSPVKKVIDKSNWDRSTKVSPATIAVVKNDGRGNMGANAAAKVKNGAPGYYGSTFSPNAPVSKEYAEGVKRVYPSAYNRSQVQYTPSTGPDRGRKRSATAPSNFPPTMVPPSSYTNPKAPGNNKATTPTPKATFNPFPPLLPPKK